MPQGIGEKAPEGSFSVPVRHTTVWFSAYWEGREGRVKQNMHDISFHIADFQPIIQTVKDVKDRKHLFCVCKGKYADTETY